MSVHFVQGGGHSNNVGVQYQYIGFNAGGANNQVAANSVTNGDIVLVAVAGYMQTSMNAANVTKTQGTATIGTVAQDGFVYGSGNNVCCGIFRVPITGSGNLELRYDFGSSGFWSLSGAVQITGMNASPYGNNSNAMANSTSEFTGSIALAQDGFVFAICAEVWLSAFTRSGNNGTVLFEDHASTDQTGWIGYADNVSSAQNLGCNLNATQIWSAVGVSYLGDALPTIEQEGFRFRNDDGNETTANWAASQDNNATAPAEVNLRLRMLINATGNPATAQYQLEYKKSTDSDWIKAT
jgi:hypothetical protein